MESEEKKNPLKPLSHGRRSAKFFDITGHSLVHPMSYNMQGFQKQIILTATYRNTLINLPSGLGMPYLTSVIIFNFQRWFLNAKIVVLSQTKSCIVELINALSSYTTLCKDLYSDLYGNTSVPDNEAAWSKPIIFSSPAKFLDNIQNTMCSVNDLVLLIVYETSKVTKCQEYKDIMTLLTGLEFRINVFIEGSGFNSKALKQIIETFCISQIEFRNMLSDDIIECTFRSEIESVSLEISPHMTSIKDAFYAVYEKYGKLLKDARVITGNVANFTKLQVQKAKEKLIKTPPQNMNKETLQNLLDGMTMCSFLCVGIEILHNWGVRSFYNYLFDENKDSELKRLIVKDDHLKNQMKLLNEYLKSNGKKMESLMSRIVHPKLIYLKNLILRSFSEAEGIIDNFRMMIFCSMDEIIDDVDGLVSNLPNFIRHQCVRTKSKSLSNTNDYKEVVQNFNSGVINVLVLNNLVDEINDLKTNLIVSLEPSKTLIKFSDPRFVRGPDKCFFVLTKGMEYQKFEALLNEKRNEQKPIELPVVEHILQDSPALFPEGFNPDFESTSVGQLIRNSNQSAGQKTIVNYLKSENDGKSKKSISVFDDSDFVDSSIFMSKPAQRKLLPHDRSPSPPLFGASAANTPTTEGKEVNNSDLYDQFYTSPLPVPYTEQIGYSNASKEDDSCDDLILDFAVPPRDKPIARSAKIEKPAVKSQSSDKENFDLKTCEIEKVMKRGNDMNHNEFKAPQNDSKPSLLSKLQSLRDRAAKLPFDLDASLSTDSSVPNSEQASPKSKASAVFDADDFFNDLAFPEMEAETVEEVPVLESPKKDSRSSKNSYPPKSKASAVFDADDIFNDLALAEMEAETVEEVPVLESPKKDSRSSKNSYPSVDPVNQTGKRAMSLKKSTFEEVTMFDSSKDDSRLSKNSRTSIDVVYDTVQNATSKKNAIKETSLFDSSKEDWEMLTKNSRTSINMVFDTGLNANTSEKTFTKKDSLFGSSKDDSRFSKSSSTSINVINDTKQIRTTPKKSLFREGTLFGGNRDGSRISQNTRTSIDVVNDTEKVRNTPKKSLFRTDTLFGGSRNDSSSSENSRTSIDVVNDTKQIRTTPKKSLFREGTLFGGSRDGSRISQNTRTSFDVVNDTEEVRTTPKKNLFRADTLFGGSRNDSRSNKNSRTSIDVVNDTEEVRTTPKKSLFREHTLFGSSRDDSRSSENSRTSIDVVKGTEEVRTTPKKNLFWEDALFGSTKDNSRLNKDSRTSIHTVNDTERISITPKKSLFRENTLFGSKDNSLLGKLSPIGVRVVNDTEKIPATLKKNIFREDTLFGSFQNDSRLGKNARTSISVVNDTEENAISLPKNSFKEKTLFGSSKNNSTQNKNSRTSIDLVNSPRQVQTSMKKFVFKEKTLFGSNQDNSRLSKNSKTSINSVNDTEQIATTSKNIFKDDSLFGISKDNTTFGKNSRATTNIVTDTRRSPVSSKSPIFSVKKPTTTLAKNNQLKDQSTSIHFGSSFELGDDSFPSDFCPNPPKAPVEAKRLEFSPKKNPDELKQSDDSSSGDEKPPDTANIDDWDPDCELFQDEEDTFDNAVAGIATPQKDPVSVKTSTPVVNSTKIQPVSVENPPVVDLVSPQKEAKNKADSLWCKNTASVDSSISNELPKPNRSLKNPSTDTCDINISDNCRKKAISNSFFANFSLSLKQRHLQNSQNKTTITKPPRMEDDADDFPWMKTKAKPPEKAKLKTTSDDETVYPWMKESPVKPSSSSGGSSWLRKSPVQNVPLSRLGSPKAPIASTSSLAVNRASSPCVAHSTPEFKKPSPFVIRSSTSRSAQSSSGSDQKSASSETPPDLVANMVKKKKRKTHLKRNLAEQFLDNEAEATSDDSDSTRVEGELDRSYENNSFIDDEDSNKKTNYSHYLKSIKSPRTEVGKFRIPVLSESKLKMNVCSQMDYYDQTYQQDSFCVDDVDTLDQDSEYIPSVLTQMEDRLKFDKKAAKRLPAVSSEEESNPENTSANSALRHKKKYRKRIVCFSSSDDDDDNFK